MENKKYFDVFFEKIINEPEIKKLIEYIKHYNNENDDRYNKYILKLDKIFNKFEHYNNENLYKKYLFKLNIHLLLIKLIETINEYLTTKDDYNELRGHYLKTINGACIMGARLYCFIVPNNLRKHTPEKQDIFTFGYINWNEGHKEYLLDTYKKILDELNINVLLDYGRMD